MILLSGIWDENFFGLEEMETNTGLKQDYPASTSLFKMITHRIMSSVEEEGE